MKTILYRGQKYVQARYYIAGPGKEILNEWWAKANKKLVKVWKGLNKKFFEGKLKQPGFGFFDDQSKPSQSTHLAHYHDTGYIAFLDTWLYAHLDYPVQGFLTKMMLHEMIHQAIYELHGQDAHENDNHGPLFLSIAKKCGLSKDGITGGRLSASTWTRSSTKLPWVNPKAAKT